MPPFKARMITALALAASGLVVLGASPAQAATDAGAFTPVDPYRVLDTRNGIGAARAQVQPGKSVAVQIAGQGGIPSTGVGAAVLNVTVTHAARAGYVTAYPTGATRPNASNLNFVAGQTIANHVTVGVGDGKVTLFNGSAGPVDLIADVAGWYRDGTASDAGTFTPLSSPTRLLDTRNGIGAPKAQIASQHDVAFAIPGSSVGAGALNVTVTRPTAGGFITAYPNGTSRPNASNLNFVAGQTIANAATVKTGNDGKVALYNGSNGGADLIADLAGTFKAGSAAVTGAYTPVAPVRLLDTRNGIGTSKAQVPAGDSVTLTVAGQGGVPDIGANPAAGAVALNVTATNASAPGYITAYPTGSPRPNASNINFSAGQTIPNLVTVKLGSKGKVNFYNGSDQPVDVVADISGWYRAGPPPASVSSITNWTNWKLTVPLDNVNQPNDPDSWADEIKQGGTPNLATYQDPAWFHLTDAGDGVVFRANAGGATTSGSNFPRSELREMNGSAQAAWSSASGTHVMTITQAITHLPDKKPQVVAGQIHDAPGGAVGDILVVRLDGTRLFVKAGDGAVDVGNLDTDYQLGTKFKVQFTVTPAGVTVRYWRSPNDPTPAAVLTYSPTINDVQSLWYFKAGCYTQSNTDTDDFTAYGEVVIYGVDVQHA